MTVVLTEPFNNLTAWTVNGTVSIVAGGTAGTCAQTTGGIANFARYTIGAANQQPVIQVTFDYKTNSLVAANYPLQFLSDGGTVTQNTLGITTAGALTVIRGTNTGTAVATTANGLITTGTFYRIEVRVYLHDTLGTARIKVNGTTAVDATGLDTRNGGTALYDRVGINATASGMTSNWDEMVIETFGTVPMPNVWNGSAFVDATALKVYNGTAFVDATAVKEWNGTSFVDAL